MPWHPAFFDDFIDSTVSPWSTDLPVGTASISNGEMVITVTGNGDWWNTGPGKSPMVYLPFTEATNDRTYGSNGPLRFESKMTFLTQANYLNGLSCLWKDRYYVYLTFLAETGGHSCIDVVVGGGIQTFYDNHNIISLPITTPRREVSYYNPATSNVDIIAKEDGRVFSPGTVAWYISNDNGSSYIYKAQDTALAWTPERIGLGLKNWGPRPNGTVKFDFALVELYSPDIPSISNQDPAAAATEVATDSNIQFDITETEAGVDPSTISVRLNPSTSSVRINSTDNFNDASIDPRFEVVDVGNFGGSDPTWSETGGVMRFTATSPGGYSSIRYKDTAFSPDLLDAAGYAETKVSAYTVPDEAVYVLLLFDGDDTNNGHIHIRYHHKRFLVQCYSALTGVHQVLADTPHAAGAPWLWRSYWNRSSNIAQDTNIELVLKPKEHAFCYSVDNGDTWEVLWKGISPKDLGTPKSAACLRASSGNGYSGTVDFDYLTVKEIPQIIGGTEVYKVDFSHEDDFDDGSIDTALTQITGGTTPSITESNSSLILSHGAGAGSYAGVYYLYDDLAVDLRNTAALAECRITHATVGDHYCRFLLRTDGGHQIQIGQYYTGVFNVFYQENPGYSHHVLWTGAPLTYPPWRFRYVWNRSGAAVKYGSITLNNNQVSLWYSPDDGITWHEAWTGTFPGALTSDPISIVGWVHHNNAVSYPAGYAHVDYIKIATLDGSFQAGYNGASSSISTITDGYNIVVEPTADFSKGETVNIYTVGESPNQQLLASSYLFSTVPPPTAPTTSLGIQANVSDIAVVLNSSGDPTSSESSTSDKTSLKLVNRLNQFDEHGSIVGVKRNRGEKNWSYRRRIWDAFVHLANSSYRGMVYGITRELGLSLFSALSLNPKVDSSGAFLAPDPYILFKESYLYLYSDYANQLLDWQIDRYQTGGNYEHLGRLVDFINTTAFFEAEILAPADEYTRSMTLLNQSNREQIAVELLPASTRFRLKHPYVVENTVFFSNPRVFKTRVTSATQVVSTGHYHINHTDGIVTTYNTPQPKDTVRYQYSTYPFQAIASPVILSDINHDDFRVQMFSQILQDDGTYEHGLPTELGVDIINELMSLHPMYWGI